MVFNVMPSIHFVGLYKMNTLSPYHQLIFALSLSYKHPLLSYTYVCKHVSNDQSISPSISRLISQTTNQTNIPTTKNA